MYNVKYDIVVPSYNNCTRLLQSNLNIKETDMSEIDIYTILLKA